MHEGTQLRRLPWREGDKDAFVTPGNGTVNRLADIMERMSLDQAEDLAREATAAVRNPKATVHDLKPLLRLLAAATVDAVSVARLRAERLGMDNEDRDADVSGQ
ncbi:hypothetical protein ACWGBH_03500 [Streptomyces massasporeus]